MKVELTNLGIQSKVQDYTISKKLDDFGVVTEIDSKAKFDKDNGFETLLEQTSKGNTEEEALYTIECGDDDIEIDGYVLHNEGIINFNDCYAEKTLKFKSPIECIKNKDINIFDYVPYTTSTIQGTLETKYSTKTVIGNTTLFPDPIVENAGRYIMPLNEALSKLGTLDDFSSQAYFERYKTIYIKPLFALYLNTSVFPYRYDAKYIGHEITITVVWQRISNDTKLSNYWLPLPASEGAGFYLPLPPIDFIAPEIYNYEETLDLTSFPVTASIKVPYNGVRYSAGNQGALIKVDISNTFRINEIIQDIFSCSGLQLVSNFFNIDADYTNPDNNEYTFATDFLQDLKIAQSYDIIRESAIQDSFGQSGLIKAKNFVLEFNKIFGLLLVYDAEFDVMRWEHYTYFQNKGLNLETQSIEYELDDNAEINKDVVNTETWFLAQPSPTDGFYTTKIDYQNYQLNSDINDIPKKSDIFMTDLFGTINNKNYEADQYKKLFYLLSTDGTNVIGLNSSMSIRSLVENLHYKNRPLKAGLHDNRAVNFTGYSIGLETKVSIFGNFKMFNKINPGNTIKLNKKGKGTWLISEIEIEDKKITFTIKK